MENNSESNWAWVTHFLAIFFSIACMGIVIYSVIWIDDINAAKTTMGFSASILGVILGFYFNRERLTKESREKDYFNSQYTDHLETNTELKEEHSTLISTLRRTVEETSVEEE